MSEQTCPGCGAVYNGSSAYEHQCPDEERDDRIAALERRVEELENQIAEIKAAIELQGIL